MQKHTYISIQQQQQNRKGSPEQYQTIDGEKGADSVQVITDFQGSSFELTSRLLLPATELPNPTPAKKQFSQKCFNGAEKSLES